MAVAGLTEIFLQESDPRLRAKVGSVLLAYADAGLKLNPGPTEKERKYDELTQFLGEVACKQQGAVGREQKLIVETERTDEVVPTPESGNEAPEGEDLETLELMTSNDTINVEAFVDAASEGHLESIGEPELVPIPGCFPPRLRRVQGHR